MRTVKFGKYRCKTSLTEEEPWETVKLSTGSSEPDTDLTDLLKPADTTKPINSKKLADIRKHLCFIPSTYKQFYLSLFSDQNDDEKGGRDDESADQVENDTSDEENNDDIEPNATTIHVESRNKTKEKVHSNGKSRFQLRSARKHKEDDNKVSKAASLSGHEVEGSKRRK